MTSLLLAVLFLQFPNHLLACLSNTDCSLNGICTHATATTSFCTCNSAWTGTNCDVLNVKPIHRNYAGYRRVDSNGKNISSWGASVLYSETDHKWHMWNAEIINNCGLDAWQSNMHIIHAVSDTPFGKYIYVDEVVPIFAGNPAVVRGPNGVWIMLFEHSIPSPCNFTICQCSNGSTTNQCNINQNNRHCNYNTARWPSYMSYASNPNGPWSKPELIPAFRDEGNQGDFNLSPLIFPNGSALLLYRYGGGTPYNSHLRLGFADDWKNVSTYVQYNDTNLFPAQLSGGWEDPFLYRDNQGGFHAVVHSMVGETTCHRLAALDGRGSCGAHMFSLDGWNWKTHHQSGTYNGVLQVEGVASSLTVTHHSDVMKNEEMEMEALPKVIFTRRERPYMLFAPGDSCGKGVYAPCGNPIAIVTGVMYGERDGTFTLLQEIGTNDQHD